MIAMLIAIGIYVNSTKLKRLLLLSGIRLIRPSGTNIMERVNSLKCWFSANMVVISSLQKKIRNYD